MTQAAALDVLVVGSGVAGLTAAVRLAARSGIRVGVLTKGKLEQSTTRFAQGGVAAVLSGDEDSTDLHLADTLRAGAGLCDPDAVRVLVDEGPSRVLELISLGAVFDRLPGGDFQLAREGGHSMARVVHAGGTATGAEVERTLVEAVEESAAAILEGWFALDLLIDGGRCAGLTALDPDGRVVALRSSHVILASGGAGQLFDVTTNPVETTGDGVAMAVRAGVPVADVEFVQFHPTALHHPSMPRALISEALRGHGALLRDDKAERFVDELAPRDVVSRAMAARMAEHGVTHLWLDATGLDDFGTRFPNIAGALTEAGLDPSRDLLPVAPAAHHLCGGILTDLSGATALPGLWAAGEVACSGVHGANRLASNSLLEGLVFAARAVDAIEEGTSGPAASGALGAAVIGSEDSIRGRHLVSRGGSATLSSATSPPPDPEKARASLQLAMSEGAGVLRTAHSLGRTLDRLDALSHEMPGGPPPDRQTGELLNLVTVARGLLDAALARRESRGAHSRSDYPHRDEAFRLRLVIGDVEAARERLRR